MDETGCSSRPDKGCNTEIRRETQIYHKISFLILTKVLELYGRGGDFNDKNPLFFDFFSYFINNSLPNMILFK